MFYSPASCSAASAALRDWRFQREAWPTGAIRQISDAERIPCRPCWHWSPTLVCSRPSSDPVAAGSRGPATA